MKQQSDPKELEKIINEILTKNKDKVDQYKSGKKPNNFSFPDLY
jgi:Asp-tRNA(Asn)/Glu-tRNA(Gln) amidotransferase B subunit